MSSPLTPLSTHTGPGPERPIEREPVPLSARVRQAISSRQPANPAAAPASADARRGASSMAPQKADYRSPGQGVPVQPPAEREPERDRERESESEGEHISVDSSSAVAAPQAIALPVPQTTTLRVGHLGGQLPEKAASSSAGVEAAVLPRGQVLAASQPSTRGGANLVGKMPGARASSSALSEAAALAGSTAVGSTFAAATELRASFGAAGTGAAESGHVPEPTSAADRLQVAQTPAAATDRATVPAQSPAATPSAAAQHSTASTPPGPLAGAPASPGAIQVASAHATKRQQPSAATGGQVLPGQAPPLQSHQPSATGSAPPAQATQQHAAPVIVAEQVAPLDTSTRITVPFLSLGPGHGVTAHWGGNLPGLQLRSSSRESHRAVAAALEAGLLPEGDHKVVDALHDAGDEHPQRHAWPHPADEEEA